MMQTALPLSNSEPTEPTAQASSKAASRLPSRRALILLFLTLLTLLAYCAPRWNDWNQNSRLNLVRSIVDYGTLKIDFFVDLDFDNTGDFAFYKNHFYSDKPPGPALAGVLPYAALKLGLSNPVADWALEKMGKSDTLNDTFKRDGVQSPATTPRSKLIGALARIWLSILLIAAPTALMLCIFWVWACRVTGRYGMSLGLTLALGLGTTLFPYSSLLYNHALTASLLFISFYMLYNLKQVALNDPAYKVGRFGLGVGGRLMLIGFLLAFSVISQYETVLIGGPLGLYALFTAYGRQGDKSRWQEIGKRLLWLVAGAVPVLTLLVIYDVIAFGTFAPVGYEYSILWLDRHQQGFMSLTYPHPEALWGLTFGPYRGIFLMSPFLLLALPGFFFAIRGKTYRWEGVICLWAALAFYLFTASSAMWWGGHAFGPRYMIPSFPFLAFGAAFLVREATARNWKGAAIWFWLPVAVSILVILPASLAGRQWPIEEYQSPLTDYMWPQLFSGNLARNPGMAIGLKGVLSYIPLLLAFGLLYLVVYRWPFRARSGPGGQRKAEWVRLSSTIESGPTELRARDSATAQKNNLVTQIWWRSERFFVGAVIGVVLLFSTLPYVFAYLRAPKNKSFMGIMLDVPDTTQYWAWMREFQKNLVIGNPLTPEANDPVFFNPLWLILGRVNGVTGLGAEWIYQLFRVGSIIFFGWLAWAFCRFIFERALARRTAYVLIMLGCGWGFIPVIIKQFTGTLSNPLSVFVAEPNTFLSALAFPHLIFSAALMLGIFMLCMKTAESGQLKWAVGAALIALFLGLEHTYDLIMVYATIGVYWLWQLYRARRLTDTNVRRWFVIGLIVALISSPPSLYSVYITTVNPTWKGVLAQYGNAGVFTPDPLNLLVLIGPLLLLSFVGLWSGLAGVMSPVTGTNADNSYRLERLRLVKVWFVVACFLIYIPTNFQIKMLNGWQVPIFVLAVAAIFDFKLPIFNRKREINPAITVDLLTPVPQSRTQNYKSKLLLCLLVILIALPTSLYLFSWRFIDLNRVDKPYYMEKDELAAMAFLEKDNNPPKVVLSSEEVGYYLSPRTGQRPFLAHWAMTLQYYTKHDMSAIVLDPKTSPAQRKAILQEYRVVYILYGATEKEVAPELQDPNLQKVFSLPNADVYKVKGIGDL